MTNRESIIVINPGSTSTKLAWFEGETLRSKETLVHDAHTLGEFAEIWSQFAFRLRAAMDWLRALETVPNAVVGIGGLLKPVTRGTYQINEAMLADARNNRQGAHASNLGCALAAEIGKSYGCPAFIVDPVSVDEFTSLARYSGHPLIDRRSLSHALNLHATARRASHDLGMEYEHSSFVVAHLGGGISVAPVRDGDIVDVNDASSDGPFSPERTGGLPLQQFIELCYSGKYSEGDMRSLVMGKGGIKAYLGTNSLREVEDRCAGGDERSREILSAMAYQIAKEIGAMATVLQGKLDAIVLTGGMASSHLLISEISARVRFLAKILVYPGEDEMLALAQGVLRVLRRQEQPKEY